MLPSIHHNQTQPNIEVVFIVLPCCEIAIYKKIFCFLSAPDTSAPKTAATMGMSLSAIKVTWEYGTKERSSGDLDGFYIKYQAVRIGGEPIVDLLTEPIYTVIVCADINEILLTNLTSYTMYKIQVAALTIGGLGNFSEPVYGGISNMYRYH